MIRNYFKTAFRNLFRNKIYSFINIAGLSIGLSCAILILLYVKDEVSLDRFHKNVKNIYRIASISKFNGEEHQDGNTGFLQGPRFAQHIPGIQAFVRVQSGSEDIKTGTEIHAQDLLYVDSTFFSVFTSTLTVSPCNAVLKSFGRTRISVSKPGTTTKPIPDLVISNTPLYSSKSLCLFLPGFFEFFRPINPDV